MNVTAPWLAEMILITYRSAKQDTAGKLGIQRPIAHLPLPSEYIATFVIYGALSFVPGEGERIASLVGWGIALATLFNLWDPTTVGNKGGVAVKGGASTKTTTSAPVLSPTQTGA